MNLTAGFNADIARVYGITEALLLDSIAFYSRGSRRKDGYCWFTSSEFELKTSVKAGAMSRAIKHLVDLEIIESKNTYIVGTQKKCRHFKIIGTVESETFEMIESDSIETTQSETTETVESVNNSNRTLTEHHITNVIGETPETFGKPEINGMFEYWASVVGYEIQARLKANRRACSNLLNKYSSNGLEQLIRAVAASQSDKYAPRIADFEELQSKLSKLLLWGKSQGQKGTIRV